MKLLYKPFGIVIGLVGALPSKRVFTLVWGMIDREDPPKATTREASWPKVISAAAVQGATFTITRTVVDRAGARGYERLTGVWPGKEKPDPAGD